MSSSRSVRVLLTLAAAVLAAPAGAAASVNAEQAADRAVAALKVKGKTDPVIVFRSGAVLPAGTTVGQAGGSKMPSAKPSRLGVVSTTEPALMRVPQGRRAYLFYADMAPYQAYAHRGRIALVDAATGSVRISPALFGPPVVNGQLPFYMRTARAYANPANHVLSTPYRVSADGAAALESRSAFGYQVDRAPLADLALARRAADQLAADHACVLRVSDTFGDFYDFAGADRARARLGDLFYVLRQLNGGFIDERYSRTTGESPLGSLERLIEKSGCRDVLLYVAGRGFSRSDGTAVGVGTRVTGGRVAQQLLKAQDVKTFVRAHPGVQFSVKVDAPHSRGFVDLLALEPNVLLAESAAGAGGESFGYLPAVTAPDGTRMPNTGNPGGLLEFTNRTLGGMQRFLTNAAEVGAGVDSRARGTSPSFLSLMIGRAFTLGAPDDLPSAGGLHQPFFAPTRHSPQGPPPAPVQPSPLPGGPLPASSGAAAPTKDTPVAGPARNDRPVLSGTPPSVSYTENGPGTAVGTGASITDPDHATLQSAHASITGNLLSAEDRLEFTAQNGITGDYDLPTGVLTLTGAASLADYETALASITYRNLSDTPSTATRTVALQVSDGADSSSIVSVGVTVAATNDPPAITPSAGAASFIEDGSATAVDPALTLVDPDGSTVTGATIEIGAGRDTDDTLVFVNQNGISGTFSASTGLLTLIGTATAAQYQAALRSVTFTTNAQNPSTAPRTISFSATDGTDASLPVSRAMNVVSVNDMLILAPGGGSAAFTEDGPAVPVAPALTASDVDDLNLEGATAEITTNLAPGDVLEFTDQNGITGTYAAGTLTLTGTATAVQYQAAMRSIAFATVGDDPSTAPRTVSFVATDGDLPSVAVTRGVTVAAVNDTPVVTTSVGSTAFAEGDSPVTIDPALTVTDPDHASLASATVTIAAGLVTGDTLAFVDQNGIAGTFTAGTGVLALTGTATVAEYQAALRSVTYATARTDLPNGSRTIEFVASDGVNSNAAATKTIAYTAAM